MIDPLNEFYYNIILSIVLGVLTILFINQLFNNPTVVIVESENVITNQQERNSAT